MANQVLSNLTRTLSAYFRFGSIRLKDNGGVAEIRSAGDTANADLGVNRLRVKGANTSNAVVLDAPGGLGGSVTYVLPGADGATGSFLKTNGAGTLSWAVPGSSSDITEVESFTEATGSPLTLFTPSPNGVIRQISLEITAAASGGSPALQVGYAADPDAYMLTTENDPKEAACYHTFPMIEVGSSPNPVLLTILPNGQTFQGKVYVVHTVPN